jgi:hypothetical protein
MPIASFSNPSTRSSTSLPSHFKLITHSNAICALTRQLTHLRTAFPPHLRATLTSNSNVLYNGTRLHSALGYLTPDEFETATRKEPITQVA